MSLITAVLLLSSAVFILINYLASGRSKKVGEQAPGPRSWPIIGGLWYIGKFKDTTEAFSNLAVEYGSVASVKLGSFDAVVVSGLKNFRQVLVDNAEVFDARPAFKRFGILFGGNKNNSLAFADGNETHHHHRNKIAIHTFTKNNSATFENLENATNEYVFHLMEDIKTQSQDDNKMDLKPRYSQALASIFVKYFCNIDADITDVLFQNMVSNFDLVFQEINEGCIGDVLPFLMRFINKQQFVEYSRQVREFTEKRCFIKTNNKLGETPDLNNNNDSEKQKNLLNSLFDDINEDDEELRQHTMFAFEDILGGHAAISNSFIRILHYVAKNPDVQTKIRDEVREHASGFPTMSDRLTYTEAAIWEVFRFISSPIVPHVATLDTKINDFPIKKGTVVMFNNHGLNFSPDLWESPEGFMPERFISAEGQFRKPEYYLPFSTGKRGCLGYKLAINICKVILANLCQSYHIELDPSCAYDFPAGVIAVGLNKSYPYIYRPVVE